VVLSFFSQLRQISLLPSTVWYVQAHLTWQRGRPSGVIIDKMVCVEAEVHQVCLSQCVGFKNVSVLAWVRFIRAQSSELASVLDKCARSCHQFGRDSAAYGIQSALKLYWRASEERLMNFWLLVPSFCCHMRAKKCSNSVSNQLRSEAQANSLLLRV
jgi:hypothetical protein